MPRGNFWEATYDPAWDGPTQDASLMHLEGSTGLVRCRVVATDAMAATVRWRIRDRTPRRFQQCDFQLEVRDSYVSDCTFLQCRFKGSTWRDVKFSNCVFEDCDFSGITLARCYFLSDCRFLNNSASAELFRIGDTAISASAFMSGLRTNLKHLPPGVTAEYQQNRFVGTKQKIAMALFSATRNEADLEYYDQGYEQLVRCTLDYRLEKHRFNAVTKERAPKWRFALQSFPARVERWIVRASGWLTAWGRSVLKPCLFFLAVVAAFACAYASLGHGGPYARWVEVVGSSAVEALNVTLVAGYTAYFRATAPLLDRVLWVANLVLGLFWYSLIIPVLTRRILR
jgi:hypothetical protein